MLTTTNLKTLSERLRQERKALGMTQLELASRAGLRRETIIKAEKGGNIDTLSLLAIISGLGKTLALKEIGRPAYEDLKDLFDE